VDHRNSLITGDIHLKLVTIELMVLTQIQLD
jgi:hypothetical protein